ncbi:hypothetical protein TNCV_1955151 [Trichonephila clavipes]|nr:hypothetical protein TNCV_1955151 [Trichonephila clavipes]
MASTIARSHTIENFLLGRNLKYLVYRDGETTQTDEVARLHAACSSMDTALLRNLPEYAIEKREHKRCFSFEPLYGSSSRCVEADAR